MNENIKSVLSAIDELIDKATKKDELSSDEILTLFEEVLENKKIRLSSSLIEKLDKLISVTSESGNVSSETANQILSAIKEIKIEIPAPVVNVSPPNVEVTVPPVKVPDINVPDMEVTLPKEMSISKPSWIKQLFSISPVLSALKEIKTILKDLKPPRNPNDPVAVRLSDSGKFYKAVGGIASAITGHVPFSKANGSDFPALVDKDRHQQVDVLTSGLPTGAATAVKQLADDHNVTVSNQITGFATSAKQLADNHQVTVSNPTADPETGLATSVKQQPPVTTITEYNITLTSADTQYSQALPANTREFRFRCRTLFDVRYSFTTDKVATPTAPYLTLPAGSDYISDNNNLTSTTLYLASAEAGVIVELEVYV